MNQKKNMLGVKVVAISSVLICHHLALALNSTEFALEAIHPTSQTAAHPTFHDGPSVVVDPSTIWMHHNPYLEQHDQSQTYDSCADLRSELHKREHKLLQMKDTLLEKIGCGETTCTSILILSTGGSALRHAPRFGLYTLSTIFEEYPAYVRTASQQSFFYKQEYDKWDFGHRLERWIIGPVTGDANGGLFMLSSEKCPWKISFDQVDVYYYHKRVKNIWNPRGNGWKLEKPDHISIQCHNVDKHPWFSCQCSSINVTSPKGRISEYHPGKLGVYHLVPSAAKMGFLAPVYKKPHSDDFLYSHHPLGHLWLLGSSFSSWSLRLNLLKLNEGRRTKIGAFCPFGHPPKGTVWEYLQSKQGEHEVWLKDDIFQINCLS